MADAPATSSGTLAEKPLAHLLVYSAERRLSGTLTLTRDDGSDSGAMTWSNGAVARIKTSNNVCFLGSVLYELGFVEQAEVNESLRLLAAQRRPHGQILLERGSVTREQLAEGLREQALRKLVHLYSFGDDASFTFEPNVDRLAGYGGDEPVLTDPFPAIWRGIREHARPEHLRQALGHIGAGRTRLAQSAQLSRFRFQPDELAAAESLEGAALAVGPFVAEARLPSRTAELLLYCLLVTRQIEILPPGVSSSRPPKPASVMPKVNVGRPAPIPSGSFTLRMPSPMPGVGSSPSNPKIAAQIAERITMIRDRAKAIGAEDYFKRLSLPRDASTQQVAEAFTALARYWDPGSLPATMELARGDHAAVYAALVEARDALLDPHARGEYAVRLQSGLTKLPPTAKEDLAASGADNEVDGARACLAKGELDRAERLARRAHKNKPGDGEALALLAWIEAQQPRNQTVDALRQRLTMLERALKLQRDSVFARDYHSEVAAKIANMEAAKKGGSGSANGSGLFDRFRRK